MKKVLLATTALALSAGVASAEIALSGDARFGMSATEGAGKTVSAYRARAFINMSGATDNGLTFGATVPVHYGVEAKDGEAGNVYISGAFGTISVGSESSAAELAVGDLAGVGFTGAGAGNENSYGGALVRYAYSADALSVHASINSADAGVDGDEFDTDTFAIGVKYAAGDVTVGVGYENEGGLDATESHMIAGLTYAMGDTTMKAVYGKNGDDSQMGASVAHKIGAVSLAGFYRTVEDGGVDMDYYGVGAAYDLGGGAALKAGYASNNEVTTVEAGVTFSF